MTSKSSALRRLTSVVGTVAIAVAGVISMGQVASAAVGPDQPDAPETGSLTVHKYVGEEADAGTGEEITIPGAVPLEGAEFTLWRLGVDNGGACEAIDLADTNHWTHVPNGAAPADLADVQDDFCIVGPETSGETDQDGEYTFSNLPLGLYYVQETDAPANIVSKTAPFYVSIPLPHEDQNWLYDVHVYPKNQELDAPTKIINDDAEQPGKGLTVGSVVEWTISQKVPALNEGEEYTSATIWDVLNPAELEYAGTTSVSLNGTPLVEGTDYTIDAGVVSWSLTKKKLAEIRAGDTIEVVFTTTVLAVTETGDIDNPGSEGPDKPGYGSEFNGGTTPGGTTPHTYWGQLTVNKGDTEMVNKLAGAEFAVFNNAENGVCAPEAPETDAIATGVSDAEGVVRWNDVTPDNPLGLWIANSSDGEIANPNKDYCLYETKAPAGYVAGPSQVVNIKPGTNAKLVVNFENTKKEGPNLPLTGGQGTMAMTVGGIVLMLAGAGAVYVLRRRDNA